MKMDLEVLQRLNRTEREADVLQPLPDGFYETVLSELDGDSTQKYETELSRLFRCRVRKIVRSARLVVEGSSPDTKNLTPREKELHDGLLTFLELEQERLFGGISSVDGRSG